MKKENRIMTFKRFMNYVNRFNESVKDELLNKILDKISSKQSLSQKEQEFLNKFNDIDDEDVIDFRMQSKESTYNKIKELLEEGKKVICNLIDRDGKIGIQITSIFNNYEDENCTMTLKNKEKVVLKDNLSYNIIYEFNSDSYSLEMEDEFFEKIPVKDEN